MTQIALGNMRYGLLQEARLPARPNQPARPVPERVGEPSVFKHVVYIIKENRTYDQVLGDIPQGNGDPSLCIFGERITPNQHKLARDFVLLDNTYCSGILSADGHQWSDTRHHHGLHGEIVRRFPAQLSRRHGGRRRGRAGVFARRVHLGQRARARQESAHLRRVCRDGKAMDGSEPQGRDQVPRSLEGFHQRRGRHPHLEPADDRIHPPVPLHQHRGLGHEHPGRVPRAAVHQGTARVREGRQPAELHRHLPAQRSHQRHQARRADARRAGGGQRSRVWANRRGLEPRVRFGRKRASSPSKTTRRRAGIT